MKKIIIYTICNNLGMYEYMIDLKPEQIIFDSEVVNEDGVYQIEYIDGGGFENSSYYIDKLEIEL